MQQALCPLLSLVLLSTARCQLCLCQRLESLPFQNVFSWTKAEYELLFYKSVIQKYADNLKLHNSLKYFWYDSLKIETWILNPPFADINIIPLLKMKLSDVKPTEIKWHKSTIHVRSSWNILVFSCHKPIVSSVVNWFCLLPHAVVSPAF